MLKVRMVLIFLWGLAVLASAAQAAGIRVEFDPTSAATGPFPSDFLTVPDDRQRTGLRVNLPYPDCDERPSDCGEIRQINELDGFSVNPRVTVKFSGAIRTDSLRAGISLVWLDPVPGRAPLFPAGERTPINQVIYDPATFTAFAKPDVVLEQSRRYLLVVTDGVRDAAGDAVEPDPGFQACAARQIGGSYCERVADALALAAPLFESQRIVGASLFTSLSATAWLEQARAAVVGAPHQFTAGPTSPIPVQSVRSLTVRTQTGAGQFSDLTIPVAQFVAPFGVGRVVFGSIRSPRFLDATLTIPPTPTGVEIPAPVETEELRFHVWLPTRPPPQGGYPVLIAGHAIADHRWGMPTIMATANSAGYAVVAMNAFGHGGGLESFVRFDMNDGSTREVPSPGRGVDLNGDGRLDSFEGCAVFGPGMPLGLRDCLRQTAADYFQLLRAIRDGMDFDGDGTPELSRGPVSFVGQSLGSFYGTLFTAVAPDVQAAVFNVGVGNGTDTLRLSPLLRALLGPLAVGGRHPSLLDPFGAFDEQIPLRYEDVRLRTGAGAADLQDFFERTEWLEISPPMAVAPYLKQAPLPDAPRRRILFQIAAGDLTAPNPANSSLIRAANGREQTSFYRHDRARARMPQLPVNPHVYMIPGESLLQQLVSAATIQQALDFLGGTGETVPDANALIRSLTGLELFETPEVLPERLFPQ